MLKFFISALALIWIGFQPNPDPKAIALTNARLVTVTNGVIENATLLIRDGKIAALGKAVVIPSGATIIDCAGKSVYPGMIDGGSQLGLLEVNSLPETVDHDELGNITPQMQALTAVNPNSELIPVTRVNGVLVSLAVPTGGMFPGTAALIRLHGYTPEQMYAGFKGVAMNFPNTGRMGGFDRRTDEEITKTAQKALEDLNQLWQQAQEYHRIQTAFASGNHPKAPEYVPEMAALQPVIKGEWPLLIEVNTAKDIEAALTWIKARNVKAVLTGVREGWRVADKIATAGVSVIAGSVFSFPTRASDRYDRGYANPALMHKAGVKVALRSEANENARNLPFFAGYAAAYGLGKDQALKAVTIIPAEILGVSDRLGSLETGKEATLFIANGDPFEPKTQISHLFIAGRTIKIESRQTRLYEEFLNRNPGFDK
ncbi:MAG TPA: amidohydrolase [Bacteroidetes bacterium]|nr:amidohydrolase [Bacteroidota bacterium]HRR09165.1 amidohydrolase family protein [Rhodothermales bacterium]